MLKHAFTLFHWFIFILLYPSFRMWINFNMRRSWQITVKLHNSFVNWAHNQLYNTIFWANVWMCGCDYRTILRIQSNGEHFEQILKNCKPNNWFVFINSHRWFIFISIFKWWLHLVLTSNWLPFNAIKNDANYFCLYQKPFEWWNRYKNEKGMENSRCSRAFQNDTIRKWNIILYSNKIVSQWHKSIHIQTSIIIDFKIYLFWWYLGDTISGKYFHSMKAKKGKIIHFFCVALPEPHCMDWF